MGKAVEMISVFATAPSTGAAVTVATGNSLTIRQTNSKAALLAFTGLQQATAGIGRLTSPQLHDTTTGITQNFQLSLNSGITFHVPQPVYSQDTLTGLISGSATAGDIECRHLWVGYEDLPGVDGNFINTSECKQRSIDLYEVQITAAAVATGQYSTAVAVNATNDQFRANTDYAILGASFPATVATGTSAMRIIGPDFGNLGTGIPCYTYDKDLIGAWFLDMSDKTGFPSIPVFNSANKALTSVQQIGNENAASVTFTLLMAMLGPKGQVATRSRKVRGRRR